MMSFASAESRVLQLPEGWAYPYRNYRVTSGVWRVIYVRVTLSNYYVQESQGINSSRSREMDEPKLASRMTERMRTDAEVLDSQFCEQ